MRRPPEVLLKLARRGEPDRATAVEHTIDTFEAISGPHFDAGRVPAAGRSGRRPQLPARGHRSADRGDHGEQRPGRLSSAGCTTPTLVIHGLVDPLVRPSGGIATATAVPGSRLLMFNDMGHDLPATRLTEMAEAIALNATRDRIGSTV